MIEQIKSFLFGKSRNRPKTPTEIVTAVHGEMFGWPAGRILTAIDAVVIVLPKGLLSASLPLSEALDAHDEIGINIPDDGDVFQIRLPAGTWASPRRSCQAMIVGDDRMVYRFRISPEAKDGV